MYKLAIDVYYYSSSAKAVGVLFKNWTDLQPKNIITSYIDTIAEYESGASYKRELPCILELLKQVNLSQIEEIIIEGYVYLNDLGKHGLGYYLYETLNKKIPITGVAKTPFLDNNKYVIELLRGNSKKPLYITSTNENVSESAKHIQQMHGNFRFPTLLKFLDQNTKSNLKEI